MRIFATSIALAALWAASPVGAATFVVNFSNSSSYTESVQTNNDFKSDLAAAGLTRLTGKYAGITLTEKSFVLFEYMAAESGYNNIFYYGGRSGSTYTPAGAMLTEANDSLFAPHSSFLLEVDAGALDVNFWNGLYGDPKLEVAPGHEAFGIFLPSSTSPYISSTGYYGWKKYTRDVLYFGFDDQRPSKKLKPDDNHDDFIVRASIYTPPVPIVPEPATWAMMIVGFGTIGAALRRRAVRVALA